MNKLHFYKTWLTIAVWLTSWGLGLMGLAVLLIPPAQQAIARYLAEPSILERLEDQPVLVLAGLASWLMIHNGLKHWQQRHVERDRRATYQAWADRWGWAYHPEENQDRWREYGYLHGIPGYAVRAASVGKRYPCAIHTLAGPWRNHSAQAFTYYSKSVRRVRSGKSTRTKVTHYYLAVTLIHVDGHFPKLYLRRLDWSDHLVKFLKLQRPQPHIFWKTFEHQQRGKRQKTTYRIETANAIFAEQVLHSRMIDHLLKQGDVRFEVDRDVLVLYQSGRLKADTLEANLDFLHQAWQLIPPQWRR